MLLKRFARENCSASSDLGISNEKKKGKKGETGGPAQRKNTIKESNTFRGKLQMLSETRGKRCSFLSLPRGCKPVLLSRSRKASSFTGQCSAVIFSFLRFDSLRGWFQLNDSLLSRARVKILCQGQAVSQSRGTLSHPIPREI